MIETLIAHINSKIDRKLTDGDTALLSEIFQVKKIRKHQFFLQSGDVCKQVGFIVKGALKKYTIDETGKENILELMIENWWCGDKESFMMGNPSAYNIDAYEDTELLVLSKEDAREKLIKLSFFSQFNLVLTERKSIHLMRRLQSANTYTAEQKLEELKTTHPEFLQRFPQHIIASYLGMTKETLSRIRSIGLKNKDFPV